MNDDSTTTSPNELMVCPHCGARMDITGMRPFSKAVCPACGEGTRVHMQLGVYRILDCIGRGGMSEIFRAEDTILGRVIALKILNEAYSSQKDRVEKFEQEAQVMAKVQHEHIVKVYTVGRAFGHVFIAMELVNGRDLETLMKLRGAPIPEPEALAIALQSVEGLMAADSAGLVHRDIKPANILLDTSGKCKIVDFGLSLLQSEKDDSAEIWVTPYYASPEALRREFEDARSDMYALGVTLYQMLSGKTPFETIPSSVHALLELKKKIPSIRRIAPELSPMTRRIVDKLMRFDKAKRYQSYVELRADLEKARELLISEEGDWQVKRSSLIRRYRRNRVRMVAASCVGGILAVGGLVFWVTRPPAPVPVDRPVMIKPADAAPVIRSMSGEAIGKAYLKAEDAFKSGYLDDARRQFEALLNEQRSPLATSAWSALNAAMACWIMGDETQGRFLMQKMVNEVASSEESAEAKGSAVDVAQLMKILLSSAPNEGDKLFGEDGPLREYWLVGSGLKFWQDGDARQAAAIFALLQQMAASSAPDSSDQGVPVRTWKNLLSAYIQDVAAIEQLSALPNTTLAQARTRLTALENPPGQQSPGSAYKRVIASLVRQQEAHIQDLIGRAASDESSSSQDTLAMKDGQEDISQQKPDDQPQVDEQERLENERRQAEIRRARDEERRLEEERRNSLQRNREVVQTVIREACDLMVSTWQFNYAQDALRNVKDNVSGDDALNAEVQAYLEMASLANDFVDKTMAQTLRLPFSKRTVILSDGTKGRLQNYDKAREIITIEVSSRNVSRSLHELGINSLIALHRACSSLPGMKPGEVLLRNRDALVFMFLAGDRSGATATMEKWLLSNPEATLKFRDQWQGWMMALDH